MVTYRLATSKDNQQLIRLAASSGMAGDIGLRIDRNPDFFSLLNMRGETKTFVAEKDNEIIGCICVSLQDVYVGGEIFPLQYIGDFKVAGQFRNKGIGLQLCNEMADYVISQNADLAFLNVSKGNSKPVSFFKNRQGVPDIANIGVFKIYQIIGKKIKRVNTKHSIEEAELNDEILSFFNDRYKNYQLGPVLTRKNFNESKVFIIKENAKLIAAMCLADTMHVKQNVITTLSWRMNILLKLANIYCKITGLSKMPLLNEPVRMLYIKYLAVDSKNIGVVVQMINHARNIAYQKSYSYVSIGLHEKDRFNKCLSGLPKFTFRSVGMLLSIKNNTHLIQKIKDGVPFEDYSLV